MDNNTKINETIKFIDKNSEEHLFSVNDNVICVANGESYSGNITSIQTYKNDSGISERIICISEQDLHNMFKFTTIAVKMSDVEYMCKNPLAYSHTDYKQEEIERNTFIRLFESLGYEKSGVENLWEKAKEAKDKFNIPFDKLVACSVYKLSNKCDLAVPLKEICDIDIDYIKNEFIPKFESAAFISLCMAAKSLFDIFRNDKNKTVDK